jgi:predicted GIY-YIG superfamily endonuclease
VRSTLYGFEEVPFEALAKEGYNVFVYYVYILKLNNSSYYVGYTDDLEKRISQHKQGGVRTTSKILPLSLEFYCAFSSKFRAIKFERYLKGRSGFAFRNKHFI